MAGNRLRHILDFQSQIASPFAKIDVFEPERMKLCVKTAQPLPHVAAEEQKSAGRLVDFGRLAEIDVLASIAAIHGIARQHAIDSEDFEAQRRRRRKPAYSEAGLDLAGFVDEPSSSRAHPVASAGLSHWIDRRLEFRIRVEQKDQFRFQCGDSLVHSGGKTPVGGIADELYGWPLLD